MVATSQSVPPNQHEDTYDRLTSITRHVFTPSSDEASEKNVLFLF